MGRGVELGGTVVMEGGRRVVTGGTGVVMEGIEVEGGKEVECRSVEEGVSDVFSGVEDVYMYECVMPVDMSVLLPVVCPLVTHTSCNIHITVNEIGMLLNSSIMELRRV